MEPGCDGGDAHESLSRDVSARVPPEPSPSQEEALAAGELTNSVEVGGLTHPIQANSHSVSRFLE